MTCGILQLNRVRNRESLESPCGNRKRTWYHKYRGHFLGDSNAQAMKLCFQAQAIVNGFYNYLAQLEKCSSGRGLCESQGASREVYELTSANLDPRSVRIRRTQKVCRS